MFYPSEFLNGELYNEYMSIWENLFFARDKKTGGDLISSTRAKTTAEQRVTDVTNSETKPKGRCID